MQPERVGRRIEQAQRLPWPTMAKLPPSLIGSINMPVANTGEIKNNFARHSKKKTIRLQQPRLRFRVCNGGIGAKEVK